MLGAAGEALSWFDWSEIGHSVLAPEVRFLEKLHSCDFSVLFSALSVKYLSTHASVGGNYPSCKLKLSLPYTHEICRLEEREEKGGARKEEKAVHVLTIRSAA